MTGIVLIGGRSRRFGTDKVVAPVREKILIQHVIDTIEPIFGEIILIGHKRRELRNFTIIEDIMPGRGPLGGIYTGLSVCRSDHAFFFAADMPHLEAGLIQYMISQAGDHDIVIPVWSQGREPLHAIYHRRNLPAVKKLLDEDQLKIFNLLQSADTLYIPEETIRLYTDPGIAFSNINTMHDLLQ